MNLFEKQSSEFASRHIGPDETETNEMIATIGVSSLDELTDKTVPSQIRLQKNWISQIQSANLNT